MELLKYKILLEKYFEGNTSLEEEKELSHFFSSYEGRDDKFVEAKVLFAEHAISKEESFNLNFDAFMEEAQSAPKKPSKMRRLYVASSAIAASLILVVSLLVTFTTNNEQVVYAYVNGKAITNKAEAIQYSQNALKTMSTNLNKGTRNLSYMNQLNKPAALITAQ